MSKYKVGDKVVLTGTVRGVDTHSREVQVQIDNDAIWRWLEMDAVARVGKRKAKTFPWSPAKKAKKKARKK